VWSGGLGGWKNNPNRKLFGCSYFLGPFWGYVGPMWVLCGSYVGPMWVLCGSYVGQLRVQLGPMLGDLVVYVGLHGGLGGGKKIAPTQNFSVGDIF